MSDGTGGRPSILSHGERQVAAALAGDPDVDPAAIADDLGLSEETVVKAIDRIRDKTARAVATLLQSPFAEAVARDLDPAERRRLLERLSADGERRGR